MITRFGGKASLHVSRATLNQRIQKKCSPQLADPLFVVQSPVRFRRVAMVREGQYSSSLQCCHDSLRDHHEFGGFHKCRAVHGGLGRKVVVRNVQGVPSPRQFVECRIWRWQGYTTCQRFHKAYSPIILYDMGSPDVDRPALFLDEYCPKRILSLISALRIPMPTYCISAADILPPITRSEQLILRPTDVSWVVGLLTRQAHSLGHTKVRPSARVVPKSRVQA